ncbi:glycerophosphodiester phosphodiesterase domain-containing protein 5-like isoform X2 [Lineus longissimus]|uniref:glycerophosphodiester phosphodiesterase domain-containing protein 5-like isoform X2 n=1 Tax=Lineus longissimus TaxID=88925 RepID=UPI002B4DF409
MAIRRTSMKRIQRYQHNYCLLCITGCLGCKWYRYKQSRKPSDTCDVLWFVVLVLSFFLLGFFLYFMLVMKNDADNFNWFIYHQLQQWINWHQVILGAAATVFTYCCSVLILALCHIGIGYQLYMHHLHRVLLILADALAVAILIILTDVAQHEWTLQRLALSMCGPFLYVGSVIVMTLLSWLVAAKFLHSEKKGLRIFWLCVYVVVMLFLYVSPLLKKSPCVCPTNELPAKPKLIGHRGGAALSPENTMAAFKHGLEVNGLLALESDVRISLDGIPMVIHDETLHRTTNVAALFPSNVTASTSSFNSTDLEKLNAGEWFLKLNPFGTATSLTAAQTEEFRQQSIPTFKKLLEFCKNASVPIFFDLMPPKDGTHPYHQAITNITIGVIEESGIPPKDVWWSIERTDAYIPKDYTIVAKANLSREFIISHNITSVNARFEHLSDDDIQFYKSRNISVNIFMVDSEWLYSLYWCMGVTSVTSNWIHTLSKMENPIWHMTPETYLTMWVSVDCVSLLLVCAVFLIQCFRAASQKKYTPPLTTMHYKKPRNGQMKEKLLFMKDSTETLNMEPGGGVVHGIGLAAMEDEKPAESCQMKTLDVIALTDQTENRIVSPVEVNLEINR